MTHLKSFKSSDLKNFYWTINWFLKCYFISIFIYLNLNQANEWTLITVEKYKRFNKNKKSSRPYRHYRDKQQCIKNFSVFYVQNKSINRINFFVKTAKNLSYILIYLSRTKSHNHQINVRNAPLKIRVMH